MRALAKTLEGNHKSSEAVRCNQPPIWPGICYAEDKTLNKKLFCSWVHFVHNRLVHFLFARPNDPKSFPSRICNYFFFIMIDNNTDQSLFGFYFIKCPEFVAASSLASKCAFRLSSIEMRAFACTIAFRLFPFIA